MEIAATLGALVDAEGQVVPAQIVRDGIEHIIIGCDLGNSAIKLVLRQARAPQLRAFRLEAIYTPAVAVRAGEEATALRVLNVGGWREWFWPEPGMPAWVRRCRSARPPSAWPTRAWWTWY